MTTFQHDFIGFRKRSHYSMWLLEIYKRVDTCTCSSLIASANLLVLEDGGHVKFSTLAALWTYNQNTYLGDRPHSHISGESLYPTTSGHNTDRCIHLLLYKKLKGGRRGVGGWWFRTRQIIEKWQENFKVTKISTYIKLIPHSWVLKQKIFARFFFAPVFDLF